MKLTENLYAYVWQGNDNNCNSYIFANVLTGNRHILIDPGLTVTEYFREPSYDMLVKQIGQDNIRLEDIGLVVITHAHPDHMQAAKKFKEKSKALIALLKEEADLYQQFGGGEADVLLDEGELKLNNEVQSRLEVYHTPGHSSGELSLYWPEKKALAAGDVIFFQNTGRVDLPGGDANLLVNSIKRLSKLDVEYLLCGHPYGHPGVIQGKAAVKKNFDFILENIWF